MEHIVVFCLAYILIFLFSMVAWDVIADFKRGIYPGTAQMVRFFLLLGMLMGTFKLWGLV
jgi:hypothetical protein